MKFNNLNLPSGSVKNKYTKSDVESKRMPETQEKIDYNALSIAELGKNINNEQYANSAFNFKYIAREKITFNPDNDFEMEAIEELAESLLTFGLIHNFSAYYDEDTDRYVLESGERRMRACDMLRDKYEGAEDEKNYSLYLENIQPFYVNGFPVNVKRPKYLSEGEGEKLRLDSIDSQLRNIEANLEARNLTAQKRAACIEKVKQLLKERNRLLYGESASEPTQIEIAKEIGISERQIRKYSAVSQLIPELKEEFEKGNISINRVQGIAALPEEEQKIFLELLQKEKNVSPEQIKLYQEAQIEAEKARQEAEDEKARIEEELESLKTSQEETLKNIMAETKQKEEQLRREIEAAEAAKNDALIQNLQKQLENEKVSARRMMEETHRSLKNTTKALEAANAKLYDLQQKGKKEEQSIREKAELDTQVNLLLEAVRKITSLFNSLKEKDSDEFLNAITEKINSSGIQELLK